MRIGTGRAAFRGAWMAALASVAAVVGSVALAVPDDTGRIAFGRGGDLWSAASDGSGEVRLTSGPEIDRWPRWSPDGHRLAAVRDGDLVVRSATGAMLQVLTTDGDVAAAPSWSPDGSRLAYVRAAGGIAIVSATVPGSTATVLEVGPVTSVAWNPGDAERIAYTDGASISTVAPDGSGVIEIVPPDPDARTRNELAWDPQSGQVVFASTGPDGTRVEGAGVLLDGAAGLDRSPAWWPDGREMVFSRGGILHAYRREGFPGSGNVQSLGLEGETPDLQSNAAPVAVNDAAATPAATPVDVDVLANDHDPNGDPLTLTAVGTPAHGSATFTGGIVTYVPQPGFEGYDAFPYAIADGTGRTATAAVSIHVGGEPLPPPSVLTVTPSFLDFGQVALHKTKDLVVTVTNDTGSIVPLAEVILINQADPQPFDASSLDGDSCRWPWHRELDPGESCTLTVRFWAVPGAGAASPARARLLDSVTFETLATIPLLASVGAADTGPNTPPVAIDDLAGVAPGFTHSLEATRNDSDPDGDILRIIAVSDPPHGTASAPVRCIANPNPDCIGYVPDAGYNGPDAISYTVSDGRGGTASAIYHLAVGNVVPQVASVTPDSGPTAGGQSVRIAGSNFIYDSSARFVCPGGLLPLTISRLTDTEILATTPPGFTGVCALQVLTRFGQTGQLAGAYRYEDPTPVSADLSIAGTAEPDPVAVGGLLTFTPTVTNGGPGTAGGVRVTMPVGPTLDFVGSTPAGACTGPAPGTAGSVVCELGDLAAGASAEAAIVTRPTAAGLLSGTLTASASEPDPNLANNSVAAAVVVAGATPPTVTIDQAAGQPDPTSRSPIEFTVVFSEPVTGFEASDVSFAESTAGNGLTAVVERTGASSYAVFVSGMSRTGTVVASIPAGVVVDASGSPNVPSTSTDNSVAYERLATTTTLTSSRNPALTTGPTVFTATVTPVTPGTRPTGAVEFLGLGLATSRLYERGGVFVAVLTGVWLDPAHPPYTISARYMGDATHEPSVSAPLTQTIQPGTFFAEDVPGASAGFAPVAMNDAGRIAGTRHNGLVSRAAAWDPALGFFTLDGTSAFSEALGLNAAGAIVGRRGAGFSSTSGFVFRDGVLQPIPGSISAAGINADDEIAVNLQSGHAAIHHGTTTTPLARFQARGISDAGVVAGDFVDETGVLRTVIWDRGTLTTLHYSFLPTPLRVSNTDGVLLQSTEVGEEAAFLYHIDFAAAYSLGPVRAWDVNDADVVVASAQGEARVWIGGTWTPLASGAVDGMAINNRGEIVASVSGQLKRWTPVPTTSLFVGPVTAVEGGEATLTATLTSEGSPVAGQPIEFSLNDVVAGTATTGPDGVATLTNVSVSLPVGVYLHGVRAAFAGSRTFGGSFDIARLEVQAIEPADLSVTASTPTPGAPVGSTVTLNVSVSNLGPSNAPVARLNVTLPAGLLFVSDNAAGACSWVPGLGTCDFEPFAAGATRSLAIVARTTTPAALTASFVVSGLRHDPNLANNAVDVTVDAPPTVTINQAADQPDPAAVPPVRFTVVFSEPVTGFTGSDVSFVGSTVGGSLTAGVTGSGANYTVAVTGMAGLGLVTVAMPAGAAVDGGGKPSAASTSTDRTVLFGISTAAGLVFPTNGGWSLFSVVNTGGPLTGFMSYNRNSTSLFATRFTSFVINGQTARMEGFSATGRLFVALATDGGPGQPDRFRLWIEGVEQTPAAGTVTPASTLVVQPWGPDTRLKGWVDLHTHPMSNIAFGGKLFHGAPSVGSLMPAVQMPNDPVCRFDQRATSMSEALSQDGPTRGDPIQSRCGNALRNGVIKALEAFNGANIAPAGADGAPLFTYWPHWNDITHQKMWIDWIRRSWQYGQRVMVALSHNNRTLGDLVTDGGSGPITGVHTDRASSALQIEEIKRLVAANSSFMAVAQTPAELKSIVDGGRLAVVLGVELDKLGDFGPGVTQTQIEDEIDELYGHGVRYVLPIHVTDNVFGDTALYSDVYNIVNLRENGVYWTVGCAPPSDEISFRAQGFPAILAPLLPPGAPLPGAPSCPAGHVNVRTLAGLTPLGDFAVDALMKRGMIVDIDHMSDRAANRTLSRAAAVPGGGYPVTSGHSAVRNRSSASFGAENSRTTAQLARIACLGGMFGLGTGEQNGTRAVDWAPHYARAYEAMRRAFAPGGLCPQATPLGTGLMALGTDANSLVKTPRAPMLDPVGPPRFTPIYDPSNPANAGQTTLFRPPKGPGTSWDYNVDGVAHYGMFADFLRDVRTLPASPVMNGAQIVDDQMMYGADYFYRMWLKADVQKARVP